MTYAALSTTALDRAIVNEPYLEKILGLTKIRTASPPILVEAGVGSGYHTHVMASLIPECVYLAFEPDMRNVNGFVTTGLHERVIFFPAALGSRSGLVPFYLATPEPNGAVGSSSLSRFLPSLTRSFPWLRCEGVTKVMCYRLDEVMRLCRLPRLDLLWMSVQGAERLIIEGLGARLDDVAHIFTDLQGGYEDSLSLPGLLDLLNGLRTRMKDPWSVTLEMEGRALLTNRAVT